MKQMKCILCGRNQHLIRLYPATFSDKDFNYRVYSARRLPDHVHYQIVSCIRCGLVFSSPILPPERIAGLYRQSTCTYDEQVLYITKTYLSVVDAAGPVSSKSKVLEIGCGNGFFLAALRKERRIRDVWGVEPGIDMVKQAPLWLRRRITVDVFKKGQFMKNIFDLICCFHTLDHMTDPNVCIRESYNILKPGGRLVVVVHDSDGLSVKLFGERSPIFDIEHIYLFSKRTLPKLAEKYGFTVIKISDLVNTYPAQYWLRMSGLPKSFKEIGQSFLRLTGVDKINISLAGGNIYLVATKPKE